MSNICNFIDTELITEQAMTLKQVGEIVKLYRIKKGLSQKQLADLAEVDQANISRIENGVEESAQVMDKVPKALGIKIQITFPREQGE